MINFQNTSICEFPSRMFYDGKLKTAHENIGRPRNPLKMWRKSNNIPRVFCHVEGEEETLTVKTKEGNEQFSSNKKEIEQVVSRLSILSIFIKRLYDSYF